MTESQAKISAEPVVKAVVNCMADGNYQNLPEYAEFTEGDSPELFQKFADEYLKLNDLSHFDHYDVPCNFNPHYQNGSEYHKFEVFLWKNNKGFSIDYDLTTDGDLNDLTLQMDFFFQENHTLRAVITDIHVL